MWSEEVVNCVSSKGRSFLPVHTGRWVDELKDVPKEWWENSNCIGFHFSSKKSCLKRGLGPKEQNPFTMGQRVQSWTFND